MITEPQFRRDFPEFASDVIYPDPQVNMWLALARTMLNSPPWDNTPGIAGPAGAISAITWAGNVATVTTPSPHGFIGSFDVTIAGTVPTAYSGTYFATVTDATHFTYSLPLASDPGAATTAGTYQAAMNSVLDIGTELYAAHMLVLQKKALDASAVGKTPGEQVGPLSNKSLGPGSMGFDVAAGTMANASFWNMTSYGTRLFFLSDMMGAGPIQIGIGCDPQGAFGFNGPAWPGPWPWPSQTGFG